MLEENVKPEYVWFNGTVNYTLMGDPIDKARQPIAINSFEGSAGDGKSLIWPVKLFRGKQPFDPINKTLVVTHLAGEDDTAYWKNMVWDKAVAEGMKTMHKPFSGKVDFIETTAMWPITSPTPLVTSICLKPPPAPMIRMIAAVGARQIGRAHV